MKILWTILRWLKERDTAPDTVWCLDPLSHPQIERMDERERADLPFGRSASKIAHR